MAFQCTMCGKCCSGKGGIVLSAFDRQRLSTFLACTEQDLIKNYTYTNNGKIKIISKNDFCIFFDPKKACTIHEARPNICRAWPYFKGNIVDEISYSLASEDCTGLDKNQRHQDFAKEAIAYLIENNLIASDSKTEANALIIEDSIINKVKNDN